MAREYYTKPELLDGERRQIFSRYWTMLAHRSEVQEPRGFVTADLAGNPVLVIRDRDGALRGFHNVCRHRGALLEERCRGRLEREAIVCPYHGWSYDGHGRLVGAPNMADVAHFDRSAWGLTTISVIEWNGWILGCSDRPAPEQQAALEQLALRTAAWRCSDLVKAASLQYDVAANWKIIFENYSECYHCPLVHPNLNRLTPYTDSENVLSQGCVLGGPMALAEGVETMSMTGSAIAPPIADLSSEARRQVWYFTVFPGFFLSLHPDYVMVHRLSPQDVDRTRVVCDFYVEPAAMARDDFDPAPAVEFWDQTNRQDWHVCELVQRGARSTVFAPGPMSNLESVVAAFDRYYLQALGHQ